LAATGLVLGDFDLFLVDLADLDLFLLAPPTVPYPFLALDADLFLGLVLGDLDLFLLLAPPFLANSSSSNGKSS